MSPTSRVLVALGVLWPTQGWAQTCNVAAGWTCQTVVAPAGQHGVGASVAAASDYVGIAYEVDINGATPFPELVNTHRLKYRGFEWDGTTFQSTGDALLLETVPPDGASDVYTLHAQWYDPTLDTHYITHRSPNLAGCSTAYRDLVETEVVHDALGVSNVISSSPAEDCRDRAYTWLKPDGVGGRGVTVTGKPGSATENVLSAEHAGGVWGPTIEVDAGRSDHAQFYYDGDVQVGAYHAIVDGVDRIYFWMDTPGFVPVDLGAGANLNFPTIGVADGTIKVFARLKPPGRPTFSIVERSCTPDVAAGKTCAQLSDWSAPVIRFSGLGESEMLQWVRADNGREFLVWSEAESPTMWQAHIAETCGVFSNALISHMQTPGVFRDVQSLESGMPKIALDNVNNRVHVVWSEVTDSRPGASASGHVWHGFKSFEDCP